jgi:hypothetical protein
MKTNRWIELSQRLYRQLLRLYPQAYRTTYEAEMFRLFTNQCREAYQQQGWLGILFLWLRTFVDVGKTVMIEHFSDPNARIGLLEVMPSSPLPWKGVFLVLIPGFVFFISQVAQVATDKDWFYIVYYRAAFFLVVPVLLVWAITRRFPIWGLIPLGLVYRILESYRPDYLIGKLSFIKIPASLVIFGVEVESGSLLSVSVCLSLLAVLLLHSPRHSSVPRSVWRWLAVLGLMIVLQIAGEVRIMLNWEMAWRNLNWQDVLTLTYMRQNMIQMSLWYLYEPLSFLLLVLIGKIFVRQYSGLSFLLLLGYMLPTIVFGRYGEWNNIIPFSMVMLTVLLYRFVVALLAPVWLVRTASVSWRQRAAVIPVSMAILCQIVLNVVVYFVSMNQYGIPVDIVSLLSSTSSQLIIVAGLGLAVSLYFPKHQNDVAIAPPLAAVTE